ncbi:hypothetical protein FHT93_001365 [Rhizobium sp. BK379]|nr:hypothetical protein [Rhizobium sp. BK379]
MDRALVLRRIIEKFREVVVEGGVDHRIGLQRGLGE